MNDLISKFEKWKVELESKGLRVNATKTKVMCCSHDVAGVTPLPSKYPCGVCKEGVGTNSILCTHCELWIHKRCSGIKGKLKHDPDYVCRRCLGLIHDKQALLLKEVESGSVKLEVVPTFCYLGDTCGQTGGCLDAVNARIISAWKAFRALLPILTNRGINIKTRGYVFQSCVLSVLLYGSETWAITASGLQRLSRNVNSMLRWLCAVKMCDHVSSNDLFKRLGVMTLDEQLRCNRLRYFGHIKRMHTNEWPAKVLNHKVDGKLPVGRPKQRWESVIQSDLSTLNLTPDMALDRSSWRKSIKSSKQQTETLQPSTRRKRRLIAE